MPSLAELSAVELRRRLARRDISPRELLRESIPDAEEIAAINSRLDRLDAALRMLRAAGGGLAASVRSLHGLPASAVGSPVARPPAWPSSR